MQVMEPDLKIAPPPDEKPVLTFTQHMANLDDFAVDCNAELRKRGFHICEAHVSGNWMGEAMLCCVAALNAPDRPGLSVMPVNCKLPLPWLLPESEPKDIATIVSSGLQAVENTMMEMCSRGKVLRISFAEIARRQSRTIAVAPVENGRTSILVTP